MRRARVTSSLRSATRAKLTLEPIEVAQRLSEGETIHESRLLSLLSNS